MRQFLALFGYATVVMACALEPPPNGGRPPASGGGTSGGGSVQGGSSGSIGGSTGGVSGGSGGISGEAGTGGAVAGAGATGGAGGIPQTSGGAAGDGNGGGGSSGAGSGGSGGRQYSTDPSTFFGAPRCNGFAVCESFETTSNGSLPAGFSLEGYGTRTVGVADDLAARGSRSLRFQIPSQGGVTAWLTRDSLGPLAEAHFGRVFVQIGEPAPTQFVHFDLFAGIGPFGGHSNEVRMASTGTGVGTSGSNWSFIYNVQPFGNGAGGEFGSEGNRSAHPTTGDWMCLEWSFDAAAQEAQFFLGGTAIDYLHIDTERSEIPIFETLAVGFAKYQNTDAFLVHIDEVAYDVVRIGCNN